MNGTSQQPNDLSLNGSPGGGGADAYGKSAFNYSQDEMDQKQKSLAEVKKKRKE